MPAPHTAETPLKCLLVIPTYNEAENIRVVLQDLLELETPVDILVVDDGSPDGTGDLVASHPQFGKRVSCSGGQERAVLPGRVRRVIDGVSKMDMTRAARWMPTGPTTPRMFRY
jgi:cellulose synthase/poly-beta-1,6-N-acetylglucosamine synthase-like glycosyltransferase